MTGTDNKPQILKMGRKYLRDFLHKVDNTKNKFLFLMTYQKKGLTSVQGPRAEVGLPVELFYTCWPCGGVENVPLLVPGRLVMCRQLTLHIQVRLRCQGERDAAGQTTTKAKGPTLVTNNKKTVQTYKVLLYKSSTYQEVIHMEP